MKWSYWSVLFSAAFALASSEAAGIADSGVANIKNADDEYTYKGGAKVGVSQIGDLDNQPKGLDLLSGLDSAESAEYPRNDNYASFYMAVSMIAVSEIGDKTFLIAALMAMKNSKLIVFSSAFSSLAVMTVLLGVVGHALPSLISQRVTQFLASVLFVIFGFRLLREGLSMSKEAGVDEELAEVEEELASSHMNHQMENLESGAGENNVSSTRNQKLPWYHEAGHQIENLASFILSPVWIQVFVMTFLGEWGDRSQIATIAMAAGLDYWFVILGAVVGHAICTAVACVGGQLLATRISMRNVTLGGSVAFFVFAIIYFYEFYTYTEGAAQG